MSSAPRLRFISALHPTERLRDRIFTFSSFQLHANCRALHQFTLDEKKKAERGEGPGFDGEFNNFQEPQLSSLAKLVSAFLFLFFFACRNPPLTGVVTRIWTRSSACDASFSLFHNIIS